MSIAAEAVSVWFTPVSAVEGKVRLAGAETKPSDPAVSVAVAVVAPAGATDNAPTVRATTAKAPAAAHCVLDNLIMMFL